MPNPLSQDGFNQSGHGLYLNLLPFVRGAIAHHTKLSRYIQKTQP
ncbi:MAG: hypothetical protein ACYTXC_18560 [Nostoc sp.]